MGSDNTKNYVSFHTHSDYSILDSVTDFKEYVDMAAELGQKAICFTEHGKLLGWTAKKMYCESKGIKYLHGVEAYLTESHETKVRDNYHTILIAKNHKGFLELNSLMSLSEDETHFYYKNRISFDEFLKISNNIIKTSACLASPLNKLPITHPYYERLAKKYDYYEIQGHNNDEQIKYNQHLVQLAQKYNKPLIAGTDAHSIDQYKADCRGIILSAKNIQFSGEEQFDLTYKSYNQLVSMFGTQSAILEQTYLTAIENTNSLADSVEDFEIDVSLKYPKLYGSSVKDYEKFKETIWLKFAEKINNGIIPESQAEAFRVAIEEEIKVFEKVDMCGFMLSMSEIMCWCKENNIPTSFARGSVAGSRVAYVTDIIDLNPEQWNTVFSRFCNEDRKEIGDIDIDLISEDRPRVFEYIINRFGQQRTAFVPTFQTIQSKDAILEIGRGLKFRWEKEHPNEGNNPYEIDQVNKIKAAFSAKEEQTRDKYPEMFYYYDGLIGAKVSQSVHPAGIVISPITLSDNYGTFIRDGKTCLDIDMNEIHEIGLVKYDLLILGNVKIVKDACALAGIPFPQSHTIDWDDQEVWKDMLRSSIGIFQMEGEYSFSLLREFKPKSIFDMALLNAAARPSGSSYRDRLIKRIFNKNPSEVIDELLKENLGYLVFQEDVIKFLQEICGLTGSEADNIRRAIARKDRDRLDKALPHILEGYCAKSSQPRAVAESEAKEFIRVIEDASSYMFGLNHSVAYSLLGYICAYLRKYYPYEFITSYLNNAANEDDTKNGQALATEYGIHIVPPKFGISKDEYVYDKTKGVIAKGITSIKFLNSSVSNELYNLSHNKTYNSFSDVLVSISENTSINSRQLDILIRIDYFNDFGNSKELLKILEMFNSITKIKDGKIYGKNIKKESVRDVKFLEILNRLSTDKNANGKEVKSYTITDLNGLLLEIERNIKTEKIPDFSFKEKILTQLELLGYVDVVSGNPEDRRKLLITDIYPLESKSDGVVWGQAVFTRSIGTGNTARLTIKSDVYNPKPVKKMDIIYAKDLYKNNSGYWYLMDYQKIS